MLYTINPSNTNTLQTTLTNISDFSSTASWGYFNLIINCDGLNSISLNFDSGYVTIRSYTKINNGTATSGTITVNTAIPLSDCDFIVINLQSTYYAGIAATFT